MQAVSLNVRDPDVLGETLMKRAGEALTRPSVENCLCCYSGISSLTSIPGALSNTLGRVDRRTKQPPRPTDKVGEEHAEALELGARMLVR